MWWKKDHIQNVFLKNYLEQIFDSFSTKILFIFDVIGILLMMIPFIEERLSDYLSVGALAINIVGIIWIILYVRKQKKYWFLNKPIRHLREHTYHINTVRFSPSKKYLASCGGDRMLIVWDYSSGRVHCRLKHKSWVGNFAFSQEETKLYSVTGKGEVCEWDIVSNQELYSFGWHHGETRGLDISYVANMIATSGEDGHINIDNLSFSNHYYGDKVSGSEVRKVVFNHKGTLIAFGNNEGIVSLMDLKDFSTKEIFRSPHNEMIRSFHFNYADDLLAATDSGGFVTIIDLKTECYFQTKCHNGHAICCDFSEDDCFLATGGQDNIICVWKIKSDSLVKKFEIHGHTNSVTNVIFNSADNRLISAGRDSIICEWNITGLPALL